MEDAGSWVSRHGRSWVMGQSPLQFLCHGWIIMEDAGHGSVIIEGHGSVMEGHGSVRSWDSHGRSCVMAQSLWKMLGHGSVIMEDNGSGWEGHGSWV